MSELKRQVMPLLDLKQRQTTYKEVALGYTQKQATSEAKRCLNCKHRPCMKGCPVEIEIPEFVGFLANGDIDSAYGVLRRNTSLPAVCGRVCPQESQCEKYCVRAIKGESVAIGRLERFAADHAKQLDYQKVASNGIGVAIIGSGPAGLACAGELIQYGYQVTVFEALHALGGVLTYGIPEFRLPKTIVDREIETLRQRGVNFVSNVVVGQSVTIDELLEEGYQSVFVASGAGLPRFMNIPGENLLGVFSANEYLTRINLMKAYQPNSSTPLFAGKKMIVVGGGNVAMDAARSALRQGAEVTIVYRRSLIELPARAEEVEHAKEEGIRFELLSNPIEILGNQNKEVTGVRLVRMQLGEPDASGRKSVTEIPDSRFEIACDGVIMAIGTRLSDLAFAGSQSVEKERWGGIIVDQDGLTSREYIYAGGDVVTGSATVILAMGAGKAAAKAMMKKISELRKTR